MIVDCALYRDGLREKSPADFPALLAEARESEHAFVWMGLFEPDEEQIGTVTAELGLHPLAVEDAVSAHQRPKLEIYPGMLFLVLKPVLYEDATDTVTLSEIAVFVGDSFVLTVRHGAANPLGTVRARLEQTPEVLKHGPTAVMYAVCDAVVDHYLEVAEELHLDLEGLEAEVFDPRSGRSRDTAAQIYNFKRQTLDFRRATSALTDPMRRLAGAGIPFVHEDSRPFFRDVSDHLTRVNEHVDGIDRLLGDILSAQLAQMGVQQNDDMRRISAYAAMAAVPTVIGGVYGMNFDHMPELHWMFSYPVVLTVMFTAVFSLYRFFKRREWL
ncbi:Cobalt/magnesium transport protein CorA [Streptomyces sp. RB5]|uniref:Magnesium transport protein CorA n=1 Tax=Streptomyces smaragdinus TaxID=2585196 RepID=A0A7K0CIG0_9ACTN|nr:magnesium/cobalt transporter CorA [Streptomyces smaragdinus]MQY13270.1 Cobalt/magnesium transport protein CorA [Streptomyces smaragdinus]